MKYYRIEPEVPAGMGPNTIMERVQGHPLIIKKLHLIFDGWLGGELLCSSPIFYVTEALKNAIIHTTLSGIERFDIIEVTKSEIFLDLYPNRVLPNFYILRMNGNAYKDDFGTEKGFLVISERAKELLDSFNLSNADIEAVEC